MSKNNLPSGAPVRPTGPSGAILEQAGSNGPDSPLDAALALAFSGCAFTRAEAEKLLKLPAEALLDLFALARICGLRAKRRYGGTQPESSQPGGTRPGSALAAPFTCGIINAKSGRCAENCSFCAQSRYHATEAPVYPLVRRETLLARARELAENGVQYMGIVISGTRPSERDFELICAYAKEITAETGIGLCASLGLLDAGQAGRLKAAGFTSYHHNLETARSFYGQICGTHGIERREETVRNARLAGLRVCSGGIFGLGESWEQRLEMAETLQELDVDSIPVNFLNPIPGTPLEKAKLLPPEEALKIVALFRLMHPARDIVVCGGRSKTLGDWENLLFSAGANGLMVGDYLTTKGSPFEKDLRMLQTLGLRREGRNFRSGDAEPAPERS